MTAPQVEIELTDYEGKRVLLETYDSDIQFVGTVLGANDEMISFKEKGKARAELVKAIEIKSIALAPDEDGLKPRRLNLVALDKVKRHLVDRHGYPVSEIKKMSAEDAAEFHESLDHEPLSHFHADPPAKDSDEAKAEEADPDTGD